MTAHDLTNIANALERNCRIGRVRRKPVVIRTARSAAIMADRKLATLKRAMDLTDDAGPLSPAQPRGCPLPYVEPFGPKPLKQRE